jgi:hypothetical protein
MKVNLGSGKTYLDGYVNVDINSLWKPDIVCDISKAIPIGTENKCQEIIAHDVLEHIPDLVPAMTNCLDMLVEGGTMDISVPYYLSLGAWQDPTHVRAFNENSWLYYTDWFWYLGWQTHRFEIVTLKFLLSTYGESIKFQPEAQLLASPKAVDSMRVILRKIALTESDKEILKHYHKR